MTDLRRIGEQLSTLLLRECGEAVHAKQVFVFDEGHAGTTLGFTLATESKPDRPFVLKLAPFGVRRRGASDLYRQVEVLRQLHGSGLAVPEILLASPDETDFGTPFLIMERLPGRTFIVWEPDACHDLACAALDRIWRSAAQQLARLHRWDWAGALDGWEAPLTPADEILRWLPILDKALDADRIVEGRALADRLMATLPGQWRTGLVHGDYQPGNLLYVAGSLTGIIDWDLVGIGPVLLDLGWLLMMGDKLCWHPDWQPHAVLPRAELIAIYEQQAGYLTEDIDWYQALACFRMGAIACHNLRLHRTGRRIDTLWERFEPSISLLFARGHALLACYR